MIRNTLKWIGTDFTPWKYFGQMTDDELKAVWLYLQSLPALPQGK